MQTRSKLAILELIGGLLGWVWILASLAAAYFIVAVFAFDGTWSLFFWAAGTAVVAKWLTGGFMENQRRIAAESRAGQLQGVEALVNRYGAVLESSDVVSSDEKLPASKDEIKRALIAAAMAAKAAGQSIEPLRVGYASLANFVPPDEAAEAAKRQALTENPAAVSEQDLIDGLAGSDSAIEVQRKTTEEFERLMKEFDSAVD